MGFSLYVYRPRRLPNGSREPGFALDGHACGTRRRDGSALPPHLPRRNNLLQHHT